MDFEQFTDHVYSTWCAVFESLVNNGIDAKEASSEARNLVQQILMAYGSLETSHESHD